MFENIFATKQEKTPEKINEGFEGSEESAISKAVDFLEKIEPEKYKNKAANLLLAFSLFASASTAFAGEQSVDKGLPAMGEAEISKQENKRIQKNEPANFDIKNIVPKIEISMWGRMENLKEFTGESINQGAEQKTSKFYEGLSDNEFNNANFAIQQLVVFSENAEDFFTNISSSEANFSDKQKVIMLQKLGGALGNTYNFDMLNASSYVEVSDDKMFQALRSSFFGTSDIKSGICGNIHTFLTEIATNMGIEAWLQNGMVKLGMHVMSGMVLGEGEKKQIVFLDYGTLLPTGTLNYKDALGVMERGQKAISTFGSFVENKEGMFQVKSRAVDVIERAVGVQGQLNILESNFKKGEISKNENGAEVRISPEIKEIKLTSKMLELSFFKFDDVNNNPYQSMEDMSALRFGRRGVNDAKTVGVDLQATVLHMDVKDLYGGSLSKNDLAARVAIEYLDKKQLTKSEYGEFVANFGATLESAFSAPMKKRADKKTSYSSQMSAVAGGAIGAGIIYLDPNDTGRFYVRAEENFLGGISDFQNQDFVSRKIEEKFIVGADVKVFEGEVLNIEATKSNLSWGSAKSIKGGITGGNIKVSAGYEKVDSNQDRFLPSTEKSKLELGYGSGPKWRVDVIGSKTKEQYKDAKSNNVYTAEVKLRVYGW